MSSCNYALTCIESRITVKSVHAYISKNVHFDTDIYNPHQQTSLVMDTLDEALEKRGNPEGIIIHSDQGSVYASYAYQSRVREQNLVSSMSRRGNCWDNAVMESFHSNLKSEEFQYVKFHSLSLKEVKERVDQFMRYYNEERIQEKLGYHTPIEFGNMAA